MAQFSVAMSAGTDEETAPHGAISADGTIAKSEEVMGRGRFRAVCATVARGGGAWEGSLLRVRGSDAWALFVCLGAPDADTDYNSRNVFATFFHGAPSYARGSEVRDGVPRLAVPLGGTLSWRIDCAAGTVSARVGGGAWVQVFKGIPPAECAEVACGVFLDYDAEVKLLSFERVGETAEEVCARARARLQMACICGVSEFLCMFACGALGGTHRGRRARRSASGFSCACVCARGTCRIPSYPSTSLGDTGYHVRMSTRRVRAPASDAAPALHGVSELVCVRVFLR